MGVTEKASASANESGKIYTVEDFPELSLAKVDNLFTSPGQVRILILYLQEPSHKRVLEYVEILKNRDDVQSAGPSYPGSIA